MTREDKAWEAARRAFEIALANAPAASGEATVEVADMQRCAFYLAGVQCDEAQEHAGPHILGGGGCLRRTAPSVRERAQAPTPQPGPCDDTTARTPNGPAIPTSDHRKGYVRARVVPVSVPSREPVSTKRGASHPESEYDGPSQPGPVGREEPLDSGRFGVVLAAYSDRLTQPEFERLLALHHSEIAAANKRVEAAVGTLRQISTCHCLTQLARCECVVCIARHSLRALDAATREGTTPTPESEAK